MQGGFSFFHRRDGRTVQHLILQALGWAHEMSNQGGGGLKRHSSGVKDFLKNSREFNLHLAPHPKKMDNHIFVHVSNINHTTEYI